MMLFICEQILIVAKGTYHHSLVEERINDTLRVARKYSRFKEKNTKASNMMSNAFFLLSKSQNMICLLIAQSMRCKLLVRRLLQNVLSRDPP